MDEVKYQGSNKKVALKILHNLVEESPAKDQSQSFIMLSYDKELPGELNEILSEPGVINYCLV